MPPSETDKAYAAGIVDGEGSVSVLRRKSNRASYGVNVRVSMIDQDSILWLLGVFGGSYDTSNKTKSGNTIHRWTVHCRKAADFLELILPYLKLKRSRAEAAIKLARMARKRGAMKGFQGMHALTESESLAQTPLAEFIRSENQRSNAKISSYAKWGIN